MKKSLLLRLATLCLAGMLPALCLADGINFSYNHINYTTISDAELTCEVAYTPMASDDVEIPAVVTYNGKEYNVIGVAANAFNYAAALSSIRFSEGLTYVGNNAFEDCWSLKECFLPSTLRTLGSYAFYNCYALVTIEVPENVESMGIGTFFNCETLESAFLSPKVDTIPYFTFGGCKALTKVEIPEGVTTIATNAFSTCSYLRQLTLPSTLVMIQSDAFNFVYNLKTITCNAVVPPYMAPSAFEQECYDNTKVVVPEESAEAYAADANWSLFKSLGNNAVEEIADTPVKSYSLAGNLLSNLSAESLRVVSLQGVTIADVAPGGNTIIEPGVYIVRNAHESRKIFVK